MLIAKYGFPYWVGPSNSTHGGAGPGIEQDQQVLLVIAFLRSSSTIQVLTASTIKKALEDLGYINTYHASDIFRNPHDAEK